MKVKNLIILIIFVIAVVWFVLYATTPAPGTQMPDQGRKHISAEEVAKFSFNSNPPTSGPHLETWVKAGIYKTPQQDGELLHSLEHGYIEIHYNCNTETENKAPEASGSATNTSDACKKLVSQVESIARKKKLFKLLVVPSPTITTPIVLTAWTYLEPLSEYDEKKIVQFIDYHRDHGPEQTME